jgi:hypothetical protein
VIAKTELVKLVKGLDDQREGSEKHSSPACDPRISPPIAPTSGKPSDLQSNYPMSSGLIDFPAHGETILEPSSSRTRHVRVVLEYEQGDFDDELATSRRPELGPHPADGPATMSRAKLRTRIWEPLVPHFLRG